MRTSARLDPPTRAVNRRAKQSAPWSVYRTACPMCYRRNPTLSRNRAFVPAGCDI
ncbi:hypothetical protein NSERUTF1_3394 [Nocardia seriolae]|nr:hypothetical protein NSERUTF1_3394 [Nocardia seriolae]